MFERPKSGERAVLVQIYFQNYDDSDLQEFKELSRAAGAEAVEVLTATRDKPHPATYIGSGKVEELKVMVKSHDIQLVIFNHELSPAQERNLERELKCRVLSRTGLILDIFAQRARTHEGKLQVELAQLSHLSTRLVRGWTHLERQKGGIGLRGPGETQLETDRRLLRHRIKTIKARLEKVVSQREQSRKKRARAQMPTIALVGYTNAGKSTLFNALTGSDVLVANQLFATLDPTVGTVKIPGMGDIIVTDTVGFVRKLPHDLVDAFRATLEESRYADLLLHVVDVHADNAQETMEAVDAVLEEIGAIEAPTLIVFNKADLLEDYELIVPKVDRNHQNVVTRVWLSSLTGVGLDELIGAIQELIVPDFIEGRLRLESNQAQVRARLFELDAVLEESFDEFGWQLEIKLPKARWAALCRAFPDLEDPFG